jgi:hypothetical protein
MDPVTIAAVAAAIKGGTDALGAAKQGRATKEKTLAELLNSALGRQTGIGESQRQRGSDIAGTRAQTMQNLASQYIQALR